MSTAIVGAPSRLETSCATAGGGAGGLCVEQSVYTCGGASLGHPLDNEGNSCTHDGTNLRNPLPRQKCLDELVPSLDERFQASARIACDRPMYELHNGGTKAEGRFMATFGYVMFGIGAFFIVCAVCCNLIMGDDAPDENPDSDPYI